MHLPHDRLTGQGSVLGVAITYQWYLELESRCSPSLGPAFLNRFINDLVRCHGNHDFLYLQRMQSHTGTKRALEGMAVIRIGKNISHYSMQQRVWYNIYERKTQAGNTPPKQETPVSVQWTVSLHSSLVDRWSGRVGQGKWARCEGLDRQIGTQGYLWEGGPLQRAVACLKINREERENSKLCVSKC